MRGTTTVPARESVTIDDGDDVLACANILANWLSCWPPIRPSRHRKRPAAGRSRAMLENDLGNAKQFSVGPDLRIKTLYPGDPINAELETRVPMHRSFLLYLISPPLPFTYKISLLL